MLPTPSFRIVCSGWWALQFSISYNAHLTTSPSSVFLILMKSMYIVHATSHNFLKYYFLLTTLPLRPNLFRVWLRVFNSFSHWNCRSIPSEIIELFSMTCSKLRLIFYNLNLLLAFHIASLFLFRLFIDDFKQTSKTFTEHLDWYWPYVMKYIY